MHCNWEVLNDYVRPLPSLSGPQDYNCPIVIANNYLLGKVKWAIHVYNLISLQLTCNQPLHYHGN